MQEINERPVCHRAEDLVTYLYGEASETETLDFHTHLQSCEACRSEFTLFNQVHDSIVMWRNEALGASLNPSLAVAESTIESPGFVRHERKLSALASLREFFNVSPQWLRAATAFAGLLLCALLALVLSRPFQQTNKVANEVSQQKLTKEDFDKAVADQVKIEMAKAQQSTSPKPNESKPAPPRLRQTELAALPSSAKPRVKGLTFRERQQLAMDLRLIPNADEEELPFGISDQPNQ